MQMLFSAVLVNLLKISLLKAVWSMVALKLGVVLEQFLFVEHDIYLFIQKIGNYNEQHYFQNPLLLVKIRNI